MAIEKASGIVIRLSDYSETSQIATFLTDGAGRVRAIAKGSRRAGSSTGGALDLLTVNDIVYSPARSAGLATLREARTIEQFTGLRESLTRYYAALYLAELSDVFGEGSEGSSAFHDLLRTSLGALSEALEGSVANIVLHFESHALTASGLAPNLESCARCGSPLRAAREARISLEDGGVLCGQCPGGTVVKGGSLAALKRVFDSTVTSVGRLKLTGDLYREVSGFLSGALVYHGGRAPRLLQYVKRDLKRDWQRWAHHGGAGQAT